MINRKAGRLALRERWLDLLLYLLIPVTAAIVAWLQVNAYLRAPSRLPGWVGQAATSGMQADVRPARVPRESGLSANEAVLGTAELRFSLSPLESDARRSEFPLRGGTLFLGSCERLPEMHAQVLLARYAVDALESAGQGAGAWQGMAYCEGSALLPAPGRDRASRVPQGRRILI